MTHLPFAFSSVNSCVWTVSTPRLRRVSDAALHDWYACQKQLAAICAWLASPNKFGPRVSIVPHCFTEGTDELVGEGNTIGTVNVGIGLGTKTDVGAAHAPSVKVESAMRGINRHMVLSFLLRLGNLFASFYEQQLKLE
jgi:hypothetical protein